MTTVKFPARAAQAIGYLKSHSNDIDIFVEDTANPNMWVKLLRRYLPTGTKITSVNTLGGRKEVIQACRLDQGNDGRKRLYIIDADKDLLLGDRKPKLKRLYRLRRYCVENYLLDQNAVSEILTSLNPKIKFSNVASHLDINYWIHKNKKYLKSIFVSYGVSEYLQSGQITVSYSCYRLFIDQRDFFLCPSKTHSRVSNLYRHLILQYGKADVRRVFDMVESNASMMNVEVYCSAKDYILPAIYEKLKRVGSTSISLESFKILLGDHANPSIDPYLKRRLTSLIS